LGWRIQYNEPQKESRASEKKKARWQQQNKEHNQREEKLDQM
jgi:hypothetical protein